MATATVELNSTAVVSELKVRLDKWLWAARFFKTRALAREAIERKMVRYNNQHVNPNIEIKQGSTVLISCGKIYKKVLITGLSTRRRNQEETNKLFKILVK